jgi:DNA-binding transcriptional regulator YbjK
MPIRPDSHRAGGQARRARVPDAAVEIIAERGVGATTRRSGDRRPQRRRNA